MCCIHLFLNKKEPRDFYQKTRFIVLLEKLYEIGKLLIIGDYVLGFAKGYQEYL